MEIETTNDEAIVQWRLMQQAGIMKKMRSFRGNCLR